MKTPLEWLREIRRWAVIAAAFGLFGLFVWYLSSTPYDAEPPGDTGQVFRLMILGIFIVIVFLASTSALDQFNWHGPLPVETTDGYAWRRSIRSRIESLGNIGWVVFGYRLLYMPYAAWQHQDWGRLAVSGLWFALMAWVVVVSIVGAFSTRVVLTIDSKGFRGLVVPGKDVAWNRVERLSISGQLEARELTLYELGKDGAPGPAHTINLATAGISVRSFLAKVSEFAPHIEVTSPASRMADFSAA